MKTSIEGFNQSYAATLRKNIEDGDSIKEIKIDCIDLVILRWFVDFYPKMRKVQEDGKEYAFISYKKIMEDLPIINISKRGFSDRLQKMVTFKILEFKLIKEQGTYTLYGFGENYNNLIITEGCCSQGGGCCSNSNGVAVQTATKNKTIIKYNDNINNLILSKENIKRSSENDFEEVWELYPKKQGRKAAEASYVKAIKKGVSKETILEGIKKYNEYIERKKIEPQYIKQGSTWFNQECWNDEYEIEKRARNDEDRFREILEAYEASRTKL